MPQCDCLCYSCSIFLKITVSVSISLVEAIKSFNPLFTVHLLWMYFRWEELLCQNGRRLWQIRGERNNFRFISLWIFLNYSRIFFSTNLTILFVYEYIQCKMGFITEEDFVKKTNINWRKFCFFMMY